jgi:hypothetical protein
MQWRTRRRIRRSAAMAPLLWAALVAACGLLEESPPTPTPTPAASNVLIDPGFETSEPPAWLALGGEGILVLPPSQETVRSGVYSARFATDGVRGAVQSIATAEFPEFLSGYYRVPRWPRDGAFLQVTVRAPTGAFEAVPEVRFIIAGTGAAPDPAARYVFLSRDRPASGDWTYFAYPVRDAFAAQGGVPAAWASIDITVEVVATGPDVEAVAYFDDLYAGTQIGNPNRPKERRQ